MYLTTDLRTKSFRNMEGEEALRYAPPLPESVNLATEPTASELSLSISRCSPQPNGSTASDAYATLSEVQ